MTNNTIQSMISVRIISIYTKFLTKLLPISFPSIFYCSEIFVSFATKQRNVA